VETVTETNKKALSQLVNALVEDVLTTSDQEILAEYTEAYGDPKKNSDAMKTLFEKSVLKVRKKRLRAAQAGVAADRLFSTAPKVVSIENARGRLRRVLASCPPHVKLTLAARNEDELSDADVLGMLQDLEELGIVAPDDTTGSQP
jgi:hypothetical protein